MTVAGAEGPDERTSREPRAFVALTGAVSVVLTVIGAGLTDHGGEGLSPDMPAGEILAGFASAAGDARTGAAIVGLALVLQLVFLGVLWARLHKGAPWLGAVALGGGFVGAALLAFLAVVAIAGAVAADSGAAEAARMLLTVEWEYARVVVPGNVAVVGSAAVAGFGYGVFPRWFNWVSFVFAVLLVLALLPVGPAGLVGASGGLWVIIASIVMALDGRGFTSATRPGGVGTSHP